MVARSSVDSFKGCVTLPIDSVPIFKIKNSISKVFLTVHCDPMPYSASECHKLKVNENSIEIETSRDLFFDEFQVQPLISMGIILSVT